MNLKNNNPPDRVLRMTDVIRTAGVSRSSVYAKLDPKSPHFDPDWPTPIRLSARAVGWRASEIAEWLAKRPRARFVAHEEGQ